MYKLINVTELENGNNDIKEFLFERDAIFYIEGLAEGLSIANYRIANLPSPHDNQNIVQWFKAEKTVDPYNDNSEKEQFFYALIPLGEHNRIAIIKDLFFKEDDPTIITFNNENFEAELKTHSFSRTKKTKYFSTYTSNNNYIVHII